MEMQSQSCWRSEEQKGAIEKERAGVCGLHVCFKLRPTEMNEDAAADM
ncbi:hypothetical protein CRG98_048597, partial [Punica granatum]